MINNRTKALENFILNNKKVAVLVIDVQNYFADPKGRAYLESSVTALSNIKTLITFAKQSSIPIIYTEHTDTQKIMKSFYKDSIKENEWDAELISEFKNMAPLIKIKKHSYDAFYKTELADVLSKNGIEQLIITGCLTHLCCETTARTAFVMGYQVFFSSDATFTKNNELQFASLRNIADGFGLVLTTKEIIERCKVN